MLFFFSFFVMFYLINIKPLVYNHFVLNLFLDFTILDVTTVAYWKTVRLAGGRSRIDLRLQHIYVLKQVVTAPLPNAQQQMWASGFLGYDHYKG